MTWRATCGSGGQISSASTGGASQSRATSCTCEKVRWPTTRRRRRQRPPRRGQRVVHQHRRGLATGGRQRRDPRLLPLRQRHTGRRRVGRRQRRDPRRAAHRGHRSRSPCGALDGGRNLSAPSPVATITTGAAAPTLPNPLNGYGRFFPVNPSRILDTRSGLGAESAAPLQGGVSKVVHVAGLGGVAATGAQSVALNVTVTEPDRLGLPPRVPRRRDPAGDLQASTHRRPDRAQPGHRPRGRRRLGERQSERREPYVVADVVGWFGSAQSTGGGRQLQDHPAGAAAGARRTAR